MADSLDEAIKERWDSQSLGSTITGGLWMSRQSLATSAGGKPSFPVCVVDVIASSPAHWTNKNEYIEREYQFTITGASKELVEDTYGAAFQAAFRFPPLTLSTGSVLEMRPMNGDGIISLVDKGVWQVIYTYSAKYSKPVNYSPS